MNILTFLCLIILSVLFNVIALYKCVFKNYSFATKVITSSGLVILLVIDSLGFAPLLLEIGARWWWYMLLLNPVASVLILMYLFFTDRKLAVFILPQLILSLAGFLLAYQVLIHGVNLKV